jgi:hypothetical protein
MFFYVCQLLISNSVDGTVQDRLPKKLALGGHITLKAANRFLQRVYLPAHNRRFRVRPEESAFVPGIRQ